MSGRLAPHASSRFPAAPAQPREDAAQRPAMTLLMANRGAAPELKNASASLAYQEPPHFARRRHHLPDPSRRIAANADFTARARSGRTKKAAVSPWAWAWRLAQPYRERHAAGGPQGHAADRLRIHIRRH